MRFRILAPRTDMATAEQVRAARQARGWTVEQMADAVGATPLEVSAWETGAVAAPPLQGARVHWMLATDRWNAAAGGLSMATATARLGSPPLEPDAAKFDTLRARYFRWVQRLPRWARGPFNLLGEFGIVTVMIVTMPDPDSGLPARITGLGMGALIWIFGFRIVSALLRERFPRHLFGAGFLAGAAAWMPAVIYWKQFDSSAPLGDLRLWAGAAALSVAAGLWTRRGEGPAEASTAQPAQPGLAPPSAAPHLLPGTRVSGTDDVPPLRAGAVPDSVRPR